MLHVRHEIVERVADRDVNNAVRVIPDESSRLC
jgi:hypothetical protein